MQIVVSPNFRRLLALGCALFCAESGGQTPEVSSQDAQPTFTTRANLVLVRVVVRDKEGRANGTLQKEDFQLLDKGKPQVITKFSMEQTVGRKVDAPAPAAAPLGPAEK